MPGESYQLGVVSRSQHLDLGTTGIPEKLYPKAVYEVEVTDPYVEAHTPQIRERIAAIESAHDAFAKERRVAGSWQRKPGTAYFDDESQANAQKGRFTWGDPVSCNRFFMDELQSEGIDAWRSKIPSAKALGDLADPLSRIEIEDKRGKMHPMDQTAREWLSLCTDAVAIRSRGTIMAQAVREYVAKKMENAGNLELAGWHWLSIACGTALPAMKAAMFAGIKPEMLMVDLDKSALRATQNLAVEIGFEGPISQISNVNIFDVNAMGRFQQELIATGKLPDLIDLMGIFEYTGDNLGVDPAAFLRSVYDMLRPGGRLVFGQMRADRPAADFTMGVVSWPYVEMRTMSEFMSIIDAAGIPLKFTQLYLPSDGVYTVGVVDKPNAA